MIGVIIIHSMSGWKVGRAMATSTSSMYTVSCLGDCICLERLVHVQEMPWCKVILCWM